MRWCIVVKVYGWETQGSQALCQHGTHLHSSLGIIVLQVLCQDERHTCAHMHCMHCCLPVSTRTRTHCCLQLGTHKHIRYSRTVKS